MEKILIVDDSIIILKALMDILSADYEIVTLADGLETLHTAKRIKPALILLDIIMPKTNGFNVIAELKADQETENIPVIFITGLNDEVNEERGFEAGAVDYITKPFRPRTVRARVRTHVSLFLYQKRIEAMMVTDGLTGVLNRRGYGEALERLWKQAYRDKKLFSMLMIDIDFFKLYNDFYGHQSGDKILVAVAQAIKGSASRPSDVSARYGGEEFAVLLPNTNEEGCRVIANKILDSVRSLGIRHERSKVADFITVSIGGTTAIPGEHIGFDDFVKIADVMLYRAKNNGRNMFCWSDCDLNILKQ